MHMIGPRHEAAAAMMADAHTRMSGRSQACMAANGPGVMNLLPGIAIAVALVPPLCVAGYGFGTARFLGGCPRMRWAL